MQYHYAILLYNIVLQDYYKIPICTQIENIFPCCQTPLYSQEVVKLDSANKILRL